MKTLLRLTTLLGLALLPAFGAEEKELKDADGNIRPYLGAGYYDAMWNWGNYALDTDRGKVVLQWPFGVGAESMGSDLATLFARQKSASSQ